MKKAIKALSLLLLAAMMLPVTLMAQAQQMPAMPVDPEVRIGTLPNGLTYYIRHNEYPKGQADFYIAQKVGSILEEDNQRGLAHFLEHMCFNGTTNFPGKGIINWLESIGVKFGQNLNAYTSIDETVYNISNVPVAREGVQDSCLLILHDWANDLLLLPEEIDAERGVIHEEWRRSMVGQMRILEQLLPSIYPGERYGERLPIGTMEVIDNFPYQALRDYYETWYRPDQQGVIVVGDIDVDRIENKIKEMFSSIEMPANAKERAYAPVADTPGTIYAIGHDKEQNNATAQLMFKTEAMPREARNTLGYYAQDYIIDMISHMLNTRLNDISSKPGAPFAAAGMSYGEFFVAKTKDATSISAIANNATELPTALAAAYREVLRAARGGFTVTEYERAKAELLSRAETSYNNRNTRENRVYVNQYVRNFLDNNPIPSKEVEYQTYCQIAQMLPLDAINMTMKSMVQDQTGAEKQDNRIVMALMPDSKDGKYPTEAEFEAALKAVEAETIEPYKEEVKSEPLIPTMPAKGSIVSETTSEQWGATVWTLSNGATVIVKPTKYKEDEILFSALAKNGTAKYGAEYANTLTFLSVAAQSYGLGSYTDSDLQKYLSGKQASLRPSYGLYSRRLSGTTTPKDLGTLMELIYMGFTDMNYTEDEFNAIKSQYAALLQNQASNPQIIWQGKIMSTLYNSPRMQMLSAEVVNGAQREQFNEIAKAMTANAADYTFVFVGNVDLAALRGMVEQYIASLPGDASTAVTKVDPFDPQYEILGGDKVDTFTAKMETPQTWVYIDFFGNMPYNAKNIQLSSVAGQIISKRLLDKVREEMGATYSISAQGSLESIGHNNAEILTAFPTKPEMKEEVLKAIKDIMYSTDNISQEELDKVKEFMVKNYTEAKEKNGGWFNAINGWVVNGVDNFNGNIDTMNSITVEDVEAYLNQIKKQGNYRVVILDPEK